MTAPEKAHMGIAMEFATCGSGRPMTMYMEAARAAPDEIPMSPGSARGFRKRPCMNAPVNPSAAPTKIAKKDLGNRMDQKTDS